MKIFLLIGLALMVSLAGCGGGDNAWQPVANQPVFTNLNDCLIAKGHLQDENSTYWDNSQEDKDRGYAWKLFCFNAD